MTGKSNKKIAVIDTGGGMRGAYAAGIFDFCLDHGIRFDLCFGVSAGSTNLTSYLSGQRGRNLKFYTDYLLHPRYMSVRNFRNFKSYANYDYMFQLSKPEGADPLDLKALLESDQELVVVATDLNTGEPVYFGKEDIDPETYWIFKASSAIPAISTAYPVPDYPYLDGTISDPLPIDKAMEMGADKTVVIVNKPTDVPRKKAEDRFLIRLTRGYPQITEQLKTRNERYNLLLERVQALQDRNKALLLSPRSLYNVHTLSRKGQNLEKLYQEGYEDGKKILEFLSR